MSDVQKNFCAIVVRYGTATGQMSDWQTILAKYNLSTNDVDSEALFNGALSVDTSYVVQVGVKDDVSDVVYATFNIPTDKIDSHEGNGFFALGKYSEKAGFECAWDAEFYGDVTIRGGKVNDFLVETGTNGIWTYRKWDSGVLEAWTTREISFTATPTAIMGGYYTSYSIDLPDLFSNTPTCFAQGRIGNGLGYATISNVTQTTISVGVFGNQNSTTSYITSVYAVGRWK
jgi:hypothetical protein